MMKCKNCSYPLFRYSQCCPSCGRKVETTVSNNTAGQKPQTRLDFWVAGLRRSVSTGKPRRPISA